MTTVSEPVVRGLALIVGILSFLGSASADWQGLVWGMSREAAQKSFRLPHSNPPPAGYYQLRFDYTTGNIVFSPNSVIFDRHDRLEKITLNLAAKEDCESLFDVYRNIYGKPVSDHTVMDPFPTRTMLWYDPSKNNKITVEHGWEIESGNPRTWKCSVYYEPFRPLSEPPPPPPAKLTPKPGGL